MKNGSIDWDLLNFEIDRNCDKKVNNMFCWDWLLQAT